MLTNKDHTFSICAYKESPYLEECINSVIWQGSRVIVATSTPNDFIRELCKKYDLDLFINKGETGIAGDWNFALSAAETPLVTIAHQDDIYKSNYASKMLEKMNSSDNPVIFISDYGEIRNGVEVPDSMLCKTKRILITPIRLNGKSRAMKRAALSLGNSICCPSVTYVKSIKDKYPFAGQMRSNLDWQM